MHLHNTRTHKVEKFEPLNPETTRIYSCGPTVYNHAHIGNLSAYIFADVLGRVVRLSGYKTQHVMNFTDVDDKTIRDSIAKYPDAAPAEALSQLTRYYERVFLQEMQLIGNDVDALTFVRATDSIEDIKALVKKLVDQDVAYIADDGVYFSIAKYQENRTYGQLSHIELPSKAQSRIDNDEYDKESARDFALWKKQKPGEPSWPFELNGVDLTGRPGWHVECSAMSVSELGQPFDIHTGGVDLIFPHHENEIAQSTAGDQPELYSNFFLHNEHLLVDGVKMAKSKNNFYTLVDIINKGFDPLDFRMLILQSHFQSPTNFSWDNLIAARNRRRNWRNVAELRWQVADSNDDGQAEIVNNLIDKSSTALSNNLDTPNALRYIDEAFDQFSLDNTSHLSLESLLLFIDSALGLKIKETTPDVDDEIKALLNDRRSARENNDFMQSDQIRGELRSKGLEVKDSAIGQIWSRP